MEWVWKISSKAAAIKLLENASLFQDLKPSNIVVNEQYQLRILDPGLTRLIWDQESRLSQFTTELRYRSPEVLLGLNFDGKGNFQNKWHFKFYSADIWSIGCIFAQLIRREALFTVSRSSDKISIISLQSDRMTESWRTLFALHRSVHHYDSTARYSQWILKTITSRFSYMRILQSELSRNLFLPGDLFDADSGAEKQDMAGKQSVSTCSIFVVAFQK